MLKKILFLFVLLAMGFTARSQDIPPKPNTLVTDYTNSLSADQKQELENKLVAFDDTSSNQVAVVLMHSIGDYAIDEYGVKLGRAWAIGQKAHNNGILILAAMDQHKVTIQVGYGLEGALPDVIADQIIETDIKPAFRNNAYYQGLNAAVDDIIKYTKGEYKANAKPAGNSGGGSIFAIIIIIIVVLILIFRNRGGGGQIIGGRGGASPFWWFLAGDILGGGGRGGGWGGGSGGGFGGGGGGGFGGFGGGSFGGGGASGSW